MCENHLKCATCGPFQRMPDTPGLLSRNGSVNVQLFAHLQEFCDCPSACSGPAPAAVCAVCRHRLCGMESVPWRILFSRWHSEPLGGPGWSASGSGPEWAGKNRTPHISVGSMCGPLSLVVKILQSQPCCGCTFCMGRLLLPDGVLITSPQPAVPCVGPPFPFAACIPRLLCTFLSLKPRMSSTYSVAFSLIIPAYSDHLPFLSVVL